VREVVMGGETKDKGKRIKDKAGTRPPLVPPSKLGGKEDEERSFTAQSLPRSLRSGLKVQDDRFGGFVQDDRFSGFGGVSKLSA
jgi:hypothetical protein